MLGFPIHYSQGLRLLGFQLFGFYGKVFGLFEPQGTALGGGLDVGFRGLRCRHWVRPFHTGGAEGLGF